MSSENKIREYDFIMKLIPYLDLPNLLDLQTAIHQIKTARQLVAENVSPQ